MSVFWLLFKKIVPLYFLIGSGFICAKWVHIKKEDIGNLIIYLVGPIVVFTSVLEMDLTFSRLTLPVLFGFVCTLMGTLAYWTAKPFLRPSYRGIVAFASGSGNAGFFGLPLVLYLVGPEGIGVTILCILGFIFYEYSFGFYYVARGHYKPKEALKRILELPNLYALFLAIALNFMGFRLPESLHDVAMQFRGTYSVLGMLLVGLGVGSIRKWKIHYRFLALGYFFRSVAWPAFFITLNFLDVTYWHFFDSVTHKVMLLMSLVPLPAISVAVATIFDTEPEETAVLIISHTVFAVFYIPIVLVLLGNV